MCACASRACACVCDSFSGVSVVVGGKSKVKSNGWLVLRWVGGAFGLGLGSWEGSGSAVRPGSDMGVFPSGMPVVIYPT